MDTSPSSIDYDYVVDVVGFLAGLFVSVALLPQIRRAHQRKSAKDLSIFWQGAVSVGLTMQLVYLRYNRLWSVFAPVLAELVLILYLTGLKLHFDGVGKSQRAPAAPEEEEGTMRSPINRGGSVGEVCVMDDDEDQLEEEGGEGAFLIQDFGALRNPNGGSCSRGGEEIFVKYEDGAAEERGERGYNVPEFCAQPLETLSRNMGSNNGGGRVGDVRVKDEDQLEEEQESGGRGSVFLDSNAQALEPLLINLNGGGDGDFGVNVEQDGLVEENGERGFIVPDFSGQAVEPLSRNLNGGDDGDMAVNHEEILQKDSGEESFAVSDSSAQAALEPLLGEESQDGRPNEGGAPDNRRCSVI